MQLTTSGTNHYDVLDITPDASPQEIRAAYLRAKATFQKDSLAIYSLMDPTDAQDMVQKIELAYQTLSHPERRRVYDRNFHGAVHSSMEDDSPFGTSPAPRAQPSAKVVSIDRVPPMENSSGEDLLIAPATDYHHAPQPRAGAATSPFDDAAPTPAEKALPSSMDVTPAPENPRNSPAVDPLASLHLEGEEEWTGELLRKVRELRDIPLERLVEITRVRRSYLVAIEQEEFEKLPAPVFVRGFLTQMARELKLPAEKLVGSYLRRFQQWTVSREAGSR